MLEIEDIRKIIELVDDSSIHEFTYETKDEKIKLKKADANGVVSGHAPVINEVNTPVVSERQEAPSMQTNELESPVTEDASEDYDYEIVSPMVGTIYHAPSPESDPYVSTGSKITKDSIVCIVEAMKLFNEIEAEVDGEIVEILVENGELVEYGQPLFRVKTK